MRIGLDFDGTVALYDESFHQCAVEKFRMPSGIEASKPAIRDWFWQTPAGKEQWIELQGIVYGARMNEARLAPGLREFLRLCRKERIEVSIISHKTEFPVMGPRVSLRAAASRWLEDNGFHDEMGVPRDHVFFESTREGKLHRITKQRCSRFVDDLEEVFLEPAFPAQVEKLLYAPTAVEKLKGDIRVFKSWDAIRNYFVRSAA
jgi:hypothetical protein